MYQFHQFIIKSAQIQCYMFSVPLHKTLTPLCLIDCRTIRHSGHMGSVVVTMATFTRLHGIIMVSFWDQFYTNL